MKFKKVKTRLLAERGFTMVELLAVIAIIGIIMALVFPRLTTLEERHLRHDARKMAGLIRYVSESASIKKRYYRATFDIEHATMTVASSREGTDYTEESERPLSMLRLRRGIEIEDMHLPRVGKVNEGAVAVHFSPYGVSEPFTLHMKGYGSSTTLSYNPYTSKVTIADGYQ